MFRDARARFLGALRAFAERPSAARIRAGLGAVQRRSDAVLAVLLGIGVLAMVLHWR